jgi:putative ABC transport system permease protein
MMAPRNLARLVALSAISNWRRLALHAFGIVVGIASFAFFLSLSMAVRSVVLEDIFPLDEVKVVAPRASVFGMDTTKRLDDAIVDAIQARPEVVEAVPRMALAFPASGVAHFEGNRLAFEVGGFADGIDPSFLADERFAELFVDWDAEEDAARDRCELPQFTCPGGNRYYCDRADNTCRHRVPIVVSRTLVELYNGQFARSHGLPVIDDALENLLTSRAGRDRLRLQIGLGDTMVSGSRGRGAPIRRVEGMVVGISNKAMPIGVTLPRGYVERWNREYAGDEAASTYSSIEVALESREAVAPFGAWLREELELTLADQQGERFATAIFIVTGLFVLISLIIVTISAINIAHSFFLQVSERRRELGVLRAIGGTRGDIRMLVLAEAGLVGVLGGVLGVASAYAGAALVDFAAARWLPPFPFKPDSFFLFEWWIVAGGLGCAVLFAVLGGYLPARRASRMAPARALAQD